MTDEQAFADFVRHRAATDIDRLLEIRAENAASPPPDLSARVESRFRGRRRRRPTGATIAVVLLVAAGAWWGLQPTTEQRRPAAPRPFQLPASIVDAAAVTDVWPAAFVVADTPGKTFVASLDRTHLLLADRGNFYVYDRTTRAMRTLVSGTHFDPEPGAGRITLSPHWIVWQGTDARPGVLPIYRVPRLGGRPTRVASVAQDRRTSGYGIYATDDSAYWTTPGVGVTRLRLADGRVTDPPGYKNMSTDGSAWARQNSLGYGDFAIRFRNLVSGEIRQIVASPDSPDQSCGPAFCVGSIGGQHHLQRWDGSGRMSLPYPDPTIVTDGGDGLIGVSRNQVVIDPFTGKYGRYPGAEGGCNVLEQVPGAVAYTSGTFDDRSASRPCRLSTRHTYLPVDR